MWVESGVGHLLSRYYKYDDGGDLEEAGLVI